MPLGNGEVAVNAWIDDAGTLRFYISRIDAIDENGQLLKVGALKISPGNPVSTPSSFRQTLANITGATIELYNTDGAAGAARGAAIGAGLYKHEAEAFAALKKVIVVTPEEKDIAASRTACARWAAAMGNGERGNGERGKTGTAASRRDKTMNNE